MKKNRPKRMLQFTAGGLVVLMLLFAWAPSVYADESICKKALMKCLIDVTITLILSGPQTAAIYASGCLSGYLWCLEYYVDL